MSVATEIQRIKTAIANAYTAVSGKGGTVPQSAVVGNLATAIGTISTGTPLPTLTDPAAAGDILLHKEAIDGQGAKLTGTLDPLEDAELDPDSPPEIVSGELEIELVHGQDFVKELTYSVPDAVPENIIAGKTILGVAGTARKITVISNKTYTPSTDTDSITIPYGNLFALVLHTNSASELYPAAESGTNPVFRLFGVIPEGSSGKTSSFGCQYFDKEKNVKPDTGYIWSEESRTRLFVDTRYGNVAKKFISGKPYSYTAYRLEDAE